MINFSAMKNLKNLITSLVIIGVLILGVVLIFRNSASVGQNSEIPPRLAAEEINFDFGEISMAAGRVIHNFKIKNHSAEAIKLSNITTSCMCTEAFLLYQGERHGPFGMPGHGGPTHEMNETLAGGDTATMEIVFDPAAHGPAGIGPITRQVKLETSDGYLEFNVSALVKP